MGWMISIARWKHSLSSGGATWTAASSGAMGAMAVTMTSPRDGLSLLLTRESSGTSALAGLASRMLTRSG